MEKDPRKEKQNPVEKAQQVVAVVAVVENPPDPVERVGKFHYPNICWRCGKGRHQKGQPCKAVEAVCRNYSIKGHYEKVCMKGKSTHLVNVPDTSTNSSSELDYFNEHGDPVYAHMVNVKEINQKKHLIQIPISVDFKKVRNSVEKCPTVLLKADTGADVNLMNSNTFDKLIQDRTVLELTSLRMEAYGNNTAVTVLGKFHAFLRWKGHVCRQLFYVTDANSSPNLLSKDGCYTLGVLKPCYSVEMTENSSKFQGNTKVTPTQPTTHLDNAKMQGDSFLHFQNEGTSVEKHSHSTKWLLTKEQLQGVPLTKPDILDIYSDAITGNRKFPGTPYKFQLKPNVKPTRHTPRHIPIHLQEAFHQEIQNLE